MHFLFCYFCTCCISALWVGVVCFSLGSVLHLLCLFVWLMELSREVVSLYYWMTVRIPPTSWGGSFESLFLVTGVSGCCSDAPVLFLKSNVSLLTCPLLGCAYHHWCNMQSVLREVWGGLTIFRWPDALLLRVGAARLWVSNSSKAWPFSVGPTLCSGSEFSATGHSSLVPTLFLRLDHFPWSYGLLPEPLHVGHSLSVPDSESLNHWPLIRRFAPFTGSAV